MKNKKPAIANATERFRRIRERGWQLTYGLRIGLSGLVIFSLAPVNIWLKGFLVLPIVLLILLDELWLFFVIIGINIFAAFLGLLPQFLAGVVLFLVGSVHFRSRANQLFDEHIYVKLQALTWGVFTASFISLILSLLGWQFGFIHIIVALACLFLQYLDYRPLRNLFFMDALQHPAISFSLGDSPKSTLSQQKTR